MKTYSRKKSDETEEVILDLNELCRLCMSKEPELISIYNNDESIPIPVRILSCVALEVNIDEKIVKLNETFFKIRRYSRAMDYPTKFAIPVNSNWRNRTVFGKNARIPTPS